MTNKDFANLYTPPTPHGYASITGTLAALEAIKTAIQVAIDQGEPGKITIEIYGSDGEKYTLGIELIAPEKVGDLICSYRW
jgi:hypothetical protein